MLDKLIVPMLLKNGNWGKLSQNGSKSPAVSNFIAGLEDFSKLLESAKSNLSDTLVELYIQSLLTFIPA